MKLSTAIELLCDATMAEGRSLRTVEGYRRNLGYLLLFLGDMDVEAISIADLRKYAAALRSKRERYVDNAFAATQPGGLSEFTIQSYVRSVKRLFNWLTDEGTLAANPAQRLRVQVPSRRNPKAMDMGDFLRLLEATEGDDVNQVRDRAILLLLADTACRAGGLCNLHVGDIDLSGMAAVVIEKGKKTRSVPFSELTRDAVARWLAMRPACDGDWLFITMGKRSYGERLTEDGLKEVMRRLKKRTGVTGRVNPHAFRHAFAREWIRDGGDLATLSRVLGHYDPSVTARYYAVFSDQELAVFHRRHSFVARMARGDDVDYNEG